MTKTQTKQNSVKHTPTPWMVAEGKEYCFHDGNRAAIVRLNNTEGEESDETIAEVWPAANNTDIADARFIVTAVNAHDKLVEALKRAVLALDAERIQCEKHNRATSQVITWWKDIDAESRAALALAQAE